MNYLQLSIAITPGETRELLIAALSEQGIEGFEESESTLKAFVAESDFDEAAIAAVLSGFGLKYDQETIAPKNWNAAWEADFEPVIIGDFCTIRAHFHTLAVTTKQEVIITPKMSFGTGHHATTYLMSAQMEQLDFNQKTVFDFGTGTGILAILAEKLGASKVIAIDNDEWSFENAQENILLNHCTNIAVSRDSIDTFAGSTTFDIILANINRHILLHYMDMMHGLLHPGATLLMSGLLTDDEEIICKAATVTGFTVQKVNTRNNWITVLCVKSLT